MSHELLNDHMQSDGVEAVCHDLRQHIATGLLLAEPPVGEDLADGVRTRFEVLRQQFEHAAALVSLLGDSTPGRHGPADLAALARDCVASVRPVRPVELGIEGNDHVVPGDPVLLRRAIANLVDNACRAAAGTGRVIVRVGRDDAERWLEVGDDGPGFGEIGSGSGIGLTVVRDAIRSGRGRLQVEQEPGTRIRMTFPAAPGHCR